MKILSRIILFIILVFSFWDLVNASVLDEIFDTSDPKIHYCQDDDDCWIQNWIDEVKNIDGLVNDKKASEYLQDVLEYVLWFIYLISVVLIIYAWFNLTIWAWNGDEEWAKKTRTMIVYVIIWILIIFLAWPIMNFVLEILSRA